MEYIGLIVVLLIGAYGTYLMYKRLMHISVKTYYDDKSLKSVCSTYRGIKDGLETIYYPSGEVNKTKVWKNGVLDGPFVVYFKNGKPYIKGKYSDGQYSGNFVVTNMDGSIRFKKEY